MTDGEDSAIEQDGADRPDDPSRPADHDDPTSAGDETATDETDLEHASDDSGADVSDTGDDSNTGGADRSGSERSQVADPDAVPAALLERVEEATADELAAEIAGLREELAAETRRVEVLEARLDDRREQVSEQEDRIEELEATLKRKTADFQNFKKRNERKLERELERATEDLVVRLLDVRDNLERGLEQDGDIRDGVESTLRQLDDVLDAEGATRIAPDPGDPVDPESHEVLMRVPSAHPAGTVEDVHRPGYEMGEKVIRTAQILVSDGTEHDPASDDAEAAESATADGGDGYGESDDADSA